VRAQRLHYSNKDKSIVCRCEKLEHRSFHTVKNAKVQELCAGFFQLNPTHTRCTREQWRTSHIKHEIVDRRLSSPKIEPPNLSSTSRKDSFGFDSPSVIDEDRSRNRSTPTSSSCARRSSRPSHLPDDKALFNKGLNGEPDIPANIWRASRPSVFLGQYMTESLASTPLGSSFTPCQENVAAAPVVREFDPFVLLETPEVNPRAETWHGCVHDRTSSELNSAMKNTEGPHKSPLPRHRDIAFNSNGSVKDLNARFSKLRPSSTPNLQRNSIENNVAQITELACPAMAVELDATQTYCQLLRYHSLTLRELEGDSHVYVAGLTTT
jgi:hypothetical protein